jgi:general secretion pathway protein J
MIAARREVRSAGHGFTLLELLISLTILALILVTVLGAIRVGSRSWESGEQRAEESQRTRTLHETLARELSMLYPLRVKEQNADVLVFRGKPDSIEFATLPHSYGAAPFSHMVRVVTYAVEPDRGLVATERYPLVSGDDAGGAREESVKTLDARVSDARFRYLVPEGRPEEKRLPVWRDLWDPSQDKGDLSALRARLAQQAGRGPLRGSDLLPLAVEMTLTIRETRQQGVRDLILPPLVFVVQVGRTL